ncbi:sugar phosphate isomerase/epimerase and 4-hydroxyphenylpyruvate domain-containing protein [uncultured Demequina sp.]|uniref:sugar phosphate isomerase/epimerase and 4-hydroxyphenylpyruvate domain-containing protein n=1 Tax=uncultured Demequina sp. TaxID=693499 RepID=UPI0025CD0DC6|nr:sugar phosphate isomerase/epimerase and 4-hydroxyphenylpyruvate domain-containing protein [uncultured Demequina sp.]
MRTSIATVCLSGDLVQKLRACADAGFDGVEIMDADLIAADESPEEIRALCDRLRLTIDLFQPFRDVEGVAPDVFERTLRRAESKFAVMRRLGATTMLVCSNAGTATDGDDATAARQLGALADAAAPHGIRIAYEALAWGRFVNDYRHAWRLVELADRPNLGTCLDSFHILSRGHDPAEIEDIPGEKIYFLQLADAPSLDMDVLSWSRHHRLFPGEGSFALVDFLGHVWRAGYDGPLSLEVFNDTFRQTDVSRTAAHARRSLAWLADRTAAQLGWDDGQVGGAQVPTGFDFVEVGGAALDDVDQALGQLGFTFRGRHRSKPVRLWTAGDARIILNEQVRDQTTRVTGVGLTVPDADAAAERAFALGAPQAYRRTYTGEQVLRAAASPDGTEVYWNDPSPEKDWESEFIGGEDRPGPLRGVVDHVNIGYPWHEFEEALLFAGSALALTPEPVSEVPGPMGLLRSQVMRTADGSVRLPMNLAPPTAPVPWRHIAIRCADVLDAARRARSAGLPLLQVPDNYYDDIDAQFGDLMEPGLLDELRENHLFYDRDGDAEFIHLYSQVHGSVFFELVERRRGYDGYGAASAPVRMAAQRRSA